MRQTRRGCFAAQGSGAKYVWAIYSVVYGVDESAGGTGGSVRLSSSRYKMAAKAYTVSEDGTVSLTDSTRTTAANLAVGDYLVNVSTSNSTSTTGTTLYKVTGASSSGSYVNVSYTAYTPSLCAKGADTGQRVESNTADDYPVYGIQGDYYYVMVKGYGTVYVWDVFNLTTTYGYKEKTTSGYSVSMYTNNNLYVSSTYTFDTTTGYYTLTNPSATTSPSSVSGKYWMKTSSGKSPAMYYGWTEWAWTPGSTGTITTTQYSSSRDHSNVIYTKGSATGEQVQSVSQTAYPSDGVQGDYWYTYNSSYTGWFDFT